MTVAVTEPSGFASKWLPFQTAKRHVTNVKTPQSQKCLRLVVRRKLLYNEFLEITYNCLGSNILVDLIKQIHSRINYCFSIGSPVDIVENDAKVNDPVDDGKHCSSPIIETFDNRYISHVFQLLRVLVKPINLRCCFRFAIFS